MWCIDSKVDKNKYLAINYSNLEEGEYIRLLHELKSAPVRKNRTGVPTRGVFHRTLKFKLFDPVRNEMILPLLTTKKVPWKSVYHENIWFLSGVCTDTGYLKEHGVPIWDGNSTREFLDK
jgi:thymidylate synthase